MALASKSVRSASRANLETPARQEGRSSKRVPEAGRERILERSRRIVGAAYELLEEEGLEGLTIRGVLKRTGLSRRAFYERFEGKDDLVLAVFEQTIRFAASHFSEQVRVLSDPMERLKLIVTCIVLGKSTLEEADSEQSNRRGAALSREHLRLAESRPDDLQAALRPLITLIAQQLSDGMDLGLVRDYAPQRLAALVYNLVSTTVHTELLAQETAQPDRVRRVQLATDIWEFCRRAIAA
ncbi:MAG: TetR/AcrR family transcriptional regulator [Rhizomicrobium sp.]